MDASGLRDRAAWLAQALRARLDHGAADVAAVLDGWLAEERSKPFFWFVNLLECHSPCLPPKPYAELSAVARLRAAQEARRFLTMEAFWRVCITGDVPPADTLERMRAGYRGAIRYLDAWLARTLDALDRARVLDDTLVIVTADHGENFGDGGLIGHGFSLDERLLNVPFVVAGPGADGLAGVRSLAEMPRCLAEIAGVSDHPYDPDDLPPLPVAQLDSPAPPRGDERTEWAIEAWQLGEAAIARLLTPLTAAVDGDVKLVLRGEAEEFYDLVSDPLELEPLTADRVDAGAVARLRTALEHPAVLAREERRDGALATAALPDDELAELEERMRLLGYL
jgi:arylsulfatase A-like enzyme